MSDSAELLPEPCPDCGRAKAKSAYDSAAGYCSKWWAIRDPEAAEDCTQFATSPDYRMQCAKYLRDRSRTPPAPQSANGEREDFERHIGRLNRKSAVELRGLPQWPLTLNRNHLDFYEDSRTAYMWQGWQDALASRTPAQDARVAVGELIAEANELLAHYNKCDCEIRCLQIAGKMADLIEKMRDALQEKSK